MDTKGEVLQMLKKAVETWDMELVHEASQNALSQGITPYEAIEKGLGKGMINISERFNEGLIFLPQVLAASKAMEEGMAVFEPFIGKDSPHTTKGNIVIGTVQGDVHEIGKHVVCAFLRGAGYSVFDLGRDVPPDDFLEAAKERNASIVAASALMTTTLIGQKRIVKCLKEEELNIKTLFGGACCTRKWVESIGGDEYCSCGSEVVECVDRMLKFNKGD